MSLYDNSSILDDLRNEFKNGNMVTKLIMANLSVFVVFNVILSAVFWLAGQEDVMNGFLNWFNLPSSPKEFLFRPWTFFTYMFMHGDFLHILFNMIVLYFFGKILYRFLGNRKILPIYVLGGLTGAFLYILIYQLSPMLTKQASSSYLLGSSGAVMAIMLAAASYRPNYEVVLVFLGAVKIKYIALVFILLDFLTIQGNTGGHLAHFGGALFGFLFIYQLNQGKDWSVGFNKLVDGMVSWFNSKPKGPRVAYKKKKTTTTSSFQTTNHHPQKPGSASQFTKEQQAKMDDILDKIAESGYDSLSKEEKAFLFKVSRED